MPELCDTQYLLSRYGWLLLFFNSHFYSSMDVSQSNSPSSSSSQHFFFDPFSRAKINLPFMDASKLNGPVFEISTTPTSSNCIVIFISCAGVIGDKCGFEISTCHLGQSMWTTKVYGTSVCKLRIVTNVIFKNGVFYCLHDGQFFSVVDARNNEWRYIGCARPETYIMVEEPLVSYTGNSKIDNEDVMFVQANFGYSIVLEELLRFYETMPYHSDFMGASDNEFMLRSDHSDFMEASDNEFMLRFILNSETILQVRDWLKLSSFNIHAWCGRFLAAANKNIMALFHWNRFRSWLDNRKCIKATKICPCRPKPEIKGCDTQISWFEPTWVDSFSIESD